MHSSSPLARDRLDGPPSRRRAAHADGWVAHLPLVFVMLALLALVALPLVSNQYAEPLRREVRDVVEPGRNLVTDIHVALAIEGSAFHDFRDTRQAPLLERYQQAYGREMAAYARLEQLTNHLGDTVRTSYRRLRTLEARWHAMVAQLLTTSPTDGRARVTIRPEQDLYEDLLVAAASLDEALTVAAQNRRTRINDAEQMQRDLTVVLGLIALTGVAAAAWLGQRIRSFARAAEARRVALERATESRARLMRGVSHDLKNPLGAIDGHAALLEEGIKGPLSPDQKASVARIRRSVRSLLALIADLLEMSKAEAGELGVHTRSADVDEVVRDAVEEHRAAAEAAGHAVRVEIADGVPPVRTDPDRVRQVLGNLLSNAVKYTPPGGQIVVRVAERPGDGHLAAARCAAIDVIDSGPGIPGDKRDEIFDEFTRLHPDEKPGAGLGLAIARRVARLLGGDISVASRLGQGSAFTLWLPITSGDGRAGGGD